jgi:hypothetical protein
MTIFRIAACAALIMLAPGSASAQQVLGRFDLFGSATPRPPRSVPSGGISDNAPKSVPLPRPRPVAASAAAADRSEEAPQAAPKAAPRPSGPLYVAPVTPLD